MFNIETIIYADIDAITAPYIFILFIGTKPIVIIILKIHPINKFIIGTI